MNTDHRLSSLTERMARLADASAWFRIRIQRSLDRSQFYSDALLARLKHMLDAAHYAELEKSVTAWRQKGAVDPMSTANDPSLAEPKPWAAAFRDLARAECALDGVGGTVVPLNIPVPSAGASGDFDFFGEADPAPVSKITTASETMAPFKIGGIRVVTRELVQRSTPSIQAVLERDMRRSLAIGVDRRAWDPDFAGSAGVSPASICHGATEVTGTSDYEEGCRNLLMTISGGDPEKPALVMSKRVAVYFASLRNAGGQSVFPHVSLAGGSILGAPVVIGSGVPDVVTVIDASALVIGDDGAVDLSLSNEADIQMADAPSGAAAHVSFFQSGLIGLQLVRFLNWEIGRADAVAFMRVPTNGSPL